MSQRKPSDFVAQRLVESFASVEFTFDSRVCRAVAEALKPEVMRSSERFVKTEVEVEGERLRLMLRAPDLADLRAGVNSYFNLVRASSETVSANL